MCIFLIPLLMALGACTTVVRETVMPVAGTAMVAPPPGSSPVVVSGVPYHVCRGVWYRPFGGRYVVVARPRGVVVRTTPLRPRSVVVVR